MARYVICYPNEADGGTSLLMARLAQYLVESGEVIRVVDFANGAVVRHLRARGLDFEHTLPDPAGQVFAGDETVVTILLHAKFLTSHFRPAPSTRFLFWSTHPHDGMVLLPAFNVMLRFTGRRRAIAMRAVHPSYSGRVARFLDLASEARGLAYMDSQNWEGNRDVYRLKAPPHFLPVMTEAPSARASWEADRVGSRVFWVGRLSHFKTRPLQSLMRALHEHVKRGGVPVSLDVIGGGNDEASVRHLSERLSFPIRLHGALPIAEIERRLLGDADLLVGHGMSLLEGARLGVPSLLIDGWSFDLPDSEVRVRWLHEDVAGDVGRLIEEGARSSGVPLSQALAAWQRPGAVTDLGAAAFEHWRRTHALDAVGKATVAMLEDNSLTWERIQSTGFHRLDLLGRATQAAKSLYHSRRGR